MKKQLKKWGRPRLLIIGCGDVGMRLLPLVRDTFRVYAVTSQPARCAELRAAGAVPVVADLDQPDTLQRLAGLAHYIVHLAPPRAEGSGDQRTRHLTAILPDQSRLVYVSTTGVYGDCAGARLDETHPVRPQNARAVRRVAAERWLRRWALQSQSQLAILRVPGIYATDRLPLERLEKATPALTEADDVYTNHIHADDLARLIRLALFRARPQRIYHAVDHSELKMAEYFDLVADAMEMPRPPRLPRAELAQQVSPVLLSFMSESRRLDNRRLHQELRMQLTYPQVADGIAAARAFYLERRRNLPCGFRFSWQT
ncbi:SDR family oxidoreductase [Undibacterium oligocarboniphilum]|uniref:SDR family oxidoreductase n=1 Tax=Undibacterium oligocarboniphilum TaxID=666702 RepID=A0A850QIG9_9BURK|nr:SDR family oxidoreductase [Undibacterium oligocarboniphilum]MBC3871563.1 SDR family oxidoreductase [Undibacterium oligocarboniphilum]NVO79078.1 SDR family oxidoreductase [Undibacterium oligocarboniphilum]